jgi:hypothetical protein
VVIVDGFDRDHNARAEWRRELQSDPRNEEGKIYQELIENNIMRFNRISSIYATLGNTPFFIEEKGDETIKVFKLLEDKIYNFIQGKKYNTMSLAEKLSFMEQINIYIYI